MNCIKTFFQYDDGYKHYAGTIHPEKFSPTLQVIAENGRVIVESQDWASSLGFKLPGNVYSRIHI